MNTALDRERKSSAITLSDMEIFVFPELMYALVLANIMSPRIWAWREDKWFQGIDAMNPYKRILRIKQYIMDNYMFNLDLETWGLTTKEQELARFKSFIDEEMLKNSNALFGYEGDQYYFSVDIRKHFGLDKYNTNVIPFWKTETVEAMDAFKHKSNYHTGAGECVSLAALYTAALFIVGRIPLEDIYLLATPLHSQNFVLVHDGILTNNRRIVTKNMWSNGTELSAKARRALECEQITIISHLSGLIHVMYQDATIGARHFELFTEKLHAFLKTELTPEILGNFLRYRRDLQKCFQFRRTIHGEEHFIELERVFAYEANSSYLFTNQNRKNLLNVIDHDDFRTASIPSRIVLNDLEEYIQNNKLDFDAEKDRNALMQRFASDCMNAAVAIKNLIDFCVVQPKLPDFARKNKTPEQSPIMITPDMDRSAIINHLTKVRSLNTTAELAWYAYRDLSSTDPEPFYYAAITRNPVSIEATKSMSEREIIDLIEAFEPVSIYDDPTRVAQPDEVFNFSRGDGIEKAFLLANILQARTNEKNIHVELLSGKAKVKSKDTEIVFETKKALLNQTWSIAETLKR